MKIKLSKDFDALKIIGENKEVFVMNIAEFEKLEIEDLISKYGNNISVRAYSNYGGGRLKVSFGVESYVFCVPQTTVDKVKKIFNI